jgi:capsular polysaccharide biosynthesis protein
MLGLGIIVLLELLNTAVRRPVDITTKLGITPFGTLPLIRTRGERIRRRMIIIVAFAAVILAVPIGLWWLNTYYIPLDLLMQRIIDKIS